MTTSRSLSRRSLVGGALTGLALSAVAGPGAHRSYAATPAGSSAPALDTEALRTAVSDLENPPATASQLLIGGSVGRWYTSAGVADLRSGRPVTRHDKVRAGSTTKMFVATVVLQLVGERRLTLDTSVQSRLPGMLPSGFPPITVAQLLNHTSGLPYGVGWPDESTPEKVVAHRFDRWTPEQLVATVSGQEMASGPGTVQRYQGLNYVLLAMLIERLTGRPYGEEIAARVLRPLGLRDTTLPGHDRRLHGPHVHGYIEMSDGRLEDITAIDPSDSWGEGELVSTTADLDRFLAALLAGRLVRPDLLRLMHTLPPSDVKMADGTPARYGMGLQTATVNGVTFWGKTGEQYGYNTAAFATLDGRLRLVLSFNPTHRDATQANMTIRVVDALTR